MAFSHISLVQQSDCLSGQSWPMLVYLPICGFFDTSQQHFMGLGGENLNKKMYWKVVTPHEIAHQWWGNTVGSSSYRDHWMAEGFADASASIFLQFTNTKPDQYLNFWKQERSVLTEKNQFGFRPIDVGPVTMGFRLSSPKAGWSIYDSLVYPKGAYILHMLRMMMWSPKDGDGRFKTAMHDFVTTYSLRPATTEDFKAAMEKYMSQGMDLDNNHRLDWFFNEYVYGTALPTYQFESEANAAGDGTALHVKLTQSGVTQDFKMPVPIYVQTSDGKVFSIGSVSMAGNMTFDHVINLPKFAAPVKKVLINYNYDVLSVDK
jgi:aminopeptidase N